MTDFIIRFFMCNIIISGMIGILMLARWLFRNILSSRMQYNLWFLLLGLLAVPFIPFRSSGSIPFFSWLTSLDHSSTLKTETAAGYIVRSASSEATGKINDFTLSVSSKMPSRVGLVLCVVWIAGIVVMMILVIKSSFRLYALKQSALPLQNPKIRSLYTDCLSEAGITKPIPIYSTAFLKSPVITGFINPCIYLPIHLISDCGAPQSMPLQTDVLRPIRYTHPGTPQSMPLQAGGLRPIRYMLLHELQHYKHKDALAGYLMNLAGVVYWFNPFIWFALRQMRDDRETACDASVLEMLEEEDYKDYGNTLINFAEKLSHMPFPFAAGISGNMKQMKRRIMNIASYEKPSAGKRLKSAIAFVLICVLLLSLTPTLSAHTESSDYYHWNTSAENITYTDLSKYFHTYDGSFVLYDFRNDAWHIYNMEHAVKRVSPDSTYKVYDALFALEEDIITPENSFMTWNGDSYPFEEWNADQTLNSAIQSSVNWYFQTLDQRLGHSLVDSHIQEIGYGNENVTGDLSTYWMESSLKISAVEQVELLTRLYDNSFGFSQKNINAVKDALRLSSSENGTFYGKTGTGRVDDQDVNGWFVGYAETDDNTYFFATNISADKNASGGAAGEITKSILSDMNI